MLLRDVPHQMRTTLSLDADVLATARVLARRRRGDPAHTRLTLATRSKAESGDWVARLGHFHAHQPGPAGPAAELLRELRDREP